MIILFSFVIDGLPIWQKQERTPSTGHQIESTITSSECRRCEIETEN